MRLRVARSAVAADLDEIWTYIARKESVEAAERPVNSLASRVPLIAKSPGIGRSRSELRPSLQSFVVGDYRIYYRHERKQGLVRILYVRHAARSENKLPRP